MEEKHSGDRLADRMLQFAADIIRLVVKLPDNPAGKLVTVQILKSGTSSGANYEEARGAESRADFIHKLGIVLKELNETRFWLRLIKISKMLSAKDIDAPLSECEQLCNIIGKSVFTARKNRNK